MNVCRQYLLIALLIVCGSNLKSQLLLESGLFQSTVIDSGSNVWGGTSGSGLKFQINEVFVSDLPSHLVRDIEIDHTGKIWVASAFSGATASNGGIRRYHSNTIGDYEFFSVLSAGLPTRYVNDLVIDSDAYVFAAHGQHLTGATTTEGAIAVGAPSGATYNWTTYTIGLPSTDRRVLRVTRRPGKLWAFVDRSCPGCQPPKIVSYNVSATGVLTLSGDIAIPGVAFTGASNTPRIESLFTDSRDWTWAGFSREVDLAIYNGSDWTTVDLGDLFNIDVSSLDLAVSKNSIGEDECGVVWVPTNYGLFRFEGSYEMLENAGNWMRFDTTTVPDMPVPLINDIAFADSAVIATFSGLFSFDNTLCSPISFDIVHKNIRPYGANTVQTLKQISTTEPNPSIAVAGDKTAASILEITCTGLPIEQLNLALTHNDGTEERRIGKIIHSEIVGDILKLTYKHPDWMYENKQRDTVTMAIQDVTNSTLQTFDIIVYRPPLLMVHGIWANMESFEKMEQHFFDEGLYQHWQMQMADYRTTNASRFNFNSDVLPKNLQSVFISYLNRDISVGAADVVGHSMGGVLTRLYVQSPVYKNNIHKIITLNTPHSGSQFGDMMFDPEFNSTMRDFICTLLVGLDFGSCDEGAVEDLGTQSNAIMFDLNSVLKPQRNLSVHHIVTSETISNVSSPLKLLFTNSLWITIPAFLGDIFLFDLFNGDSHDLIVPAESQEGGLINSLNVTYFPDQMHTGVAANNAIIDRVQQLLGLHTLSQEFATYDFNPPYLDYSTPFFLIQELNISNRSMEFVHIDDGFEGSHFGLSDTFSIHVEGSSSVAAIVVVIADAKEKVWRKEFEGNTGTQLLATDSLNIGRKDVFAIGWDTINSAIYIDSTHFFIDFDSIPDSIRIAPQTLYVTEGKSTFLTASAYLNNKVYDLAVDTSFDLHVIGSLVSIGDEPTEITGNFTGIDSIYGTYLSATSNTVAVHVTEPPPEGISCADAIELFVSGQQPVKQIDSGNGCHNCTIGAEHASWFKFTPPSYGVIGINSCYSETETRLWVYSGSCDSLDIITGSANGCNVDTFGYSSGSFIENFIVYPGTTYFFEWDDALALDPFNFLFSFQTLCPDSTVIHVSHFSGPVYQNGSTWSKATSLFEALNACSFCTQDSSYELWIEQGTYTHPGQQRPESFVIPTDVRLYGGFDGSEITLGERDFAVNQTVLSGDIGISADSLDNVFHVVMIDSNSVNSILDGLIIENGTANGSETENRLGAGILVYGSTQLLNCVIRNCSSINGGAAIYTSGSTAEAVLKDTHVINCTSQAGAVLHSNGAIIHVENSLLIQD